MQNNVYNGKFTGDILIVGRSECGKTYYTQKLAINNFFGKLKKAEWVSYIILTREREAEIESCFQCEVEFHYLQDQVALSDLIEEFKSRSSKNSNENIVNNIFSEKKVRDRLIIMDDVSGLADESKKFAAFLTVTRKCNYNCVYIFHTVFPEKSNWRLILPQTNIFNIFPASVPINSVRKILEGACSRKTKKYKSQNAFWLNRLFFDLANTNDKICLTIDSSGVNKDGPGRFRTKADNPEFQVCYFNSKNDEQVYNAFISQIINNDENENDFHFKIIRQKSKTNKNVTFESSEELNNLKENDSASSGSEKRAKTAFEIRGSSSNLFYGEGIDKKTADNSRERSRKRAKPRFLH